MRITETLGVHLDRNLQDTIQKEQTKTTFMFMSALHDDYPVWQWAMSTLILHLTTHPRTYRDGCQLHLHYILSRFFF